MRKKAIVLGLGKSGVSSAAYLLREGYEVMGIDKKGDKLKESPEMRSLIEQGLSIQGEDEGICLDEADLIVKSPGIPPSHPLVLKAIPTGKIVDEIDLGAALLADKGKTLIAITGSNGKTSTTSFIAHVLKESGLKSAACGNIGTPILEEALKEELSDYYIVELSSFQLWAMKGNYFDLGIILNLCPNHLDWHGSFAAYKEAKHSLKDRLKNGGIFLDPGSFKKEAEEKVESIFSLSYRVEEDGLPALPKENLEAAFFVCRQLGVGEDLFLRALKTFKKPPHRLEFVKREDGVSYINDSKATTIDAVAYAVSACRAPVILIAGGIHKGGDFASWLPYFKDKVKKVLAIGRDREKIAGALEGKLEVELLDNLKEAVQKSTMLACPGDTVLLSPGCSSYDQFDSFEHRGEVFRSLLYKVEA